MEFKLQMKRVTLPISTKTKRTQAGFSLIELVVVIAIASFFGLILVGFFRGFLITSARLAAANDQNNQLDRVLSYIDLELSKSQRISTNFDDVTLPSACSSLSSEEFRVAIYGVTSVTPTVYAVKGKPPLGSWFEGNSLWRCGPKIDQYGAPIIGDEIMSIIIDGLDTNEDGDGGFSVNADDSKFKKITFKISSKGDSRNKTAVVSSQAFAKISPYFIIPGGFENACSNASFAKNNVDFSANSSFTSSSTSEQLTCGINATAGQGNLILTGSNEKDIIEGGELGEVTINGLAGNDTLRGTNDDNTINGGEDDDILIGLAGDDTLNGGSGANSYQPGSGQDIIIGNTSDLQIVYYETDTYQIGEEIADAQYKQCDQSICYVKSTSSNEIDSLCNANIIILPSRRFDIQPSSEPSPPICTPSP